MSGKTRDILIQSEQLEEDARHRGGADELIVQAVLLCAGRIVEIVGANAPHARVAQRILEAGDVTSRATLHQIRGALRAAAEIEPKKRRLPWSRESGG